MNFTKDTATANGPITVSGYLHNGSASNSVCVNIGPPTFSFNLHLTPSEARAIAADLVRASDAAEGLA